MNKKLQIISVKFSNYLKVIILHELAKKHCYYQAIYVKHIRFCLSPLDEVTLLKLKRYTVYTEEALDRSLQIECIS